MQRSRAFVSSRVSAWTGPRPFQRGDSPVALLVEYLVIAGGGGGGNGRGAGGGAGGYRSSVFGELSGSANAAESGLLVELNTNYSVTVGAGGPGSTNRFNLTGGLGVSSSFAFLVTSLGGGGGASENVTPALSGGSGGGGVAAVPPAVDTPGNGTANQGFAGGFGGPYAEPFYGAGGGGGAGAAGGNATSSGPGNGGSGLPSSITGSSIRRAGGGGGGGNATPAGSGVDGGGNGKATAGAAGDPGSANSGGGGGGGAGTATRGPGGAGGSGVVILRYPLENTLTVGPGLVSNGPITVGANKVTTITAGTGNVSWS